MKNKKVIGKFKWDNPERDIDTTSVKEVNDAFWRATDGGEMVFVENEEELQQALNEGWIEKQDKTIIFYDLI